jgi:uncharacterized membrane protein (UPF0136 family)
MSTSNPIRWSGLALMLAGALVAIPTLLHPDEIANPSVMMDASWVPVHTAFIAGLVLMLFGLIGLYRRQLEKSGLLGHIGFGLTFAGAALTIAIITIDAYVIPVVAASAVGSNLLDPNGPLFGGPLGLEFLLAGVATALGTVALGIDIIRAGVLPRAAGVLLLIGGPIMGFAGLVPHIVFLIGGVLMGASLIWLGYAVFANVRPATVPMPETAKA